MKNRTAGDDKMMVSSRTKFLGAGYYEKNRDTLVSLIKKHLPEGGVILDAGCGEGYYTNGIAELSRSSANDYNIIGIDASKFACDAAAKGARRTGVSDFASYAVASLSDQPIADGKIDLVVSLFSPCAYNEFARILSDGGLAIIGSAGKSHLYELKEVLYGPGNVRDNEPFIHAERAAGSGLEFLDSVNLKYETTVYGKEHIDALFSMTPYYWRTPKSGAEALLKHDELTVTVEVDYTVLIKK